MTSSIKLTLTLISLFFSMLIATMLIFISMREHEFQYLQYIESSMLALAHNTSEELVDAVSSENIFVDATSVLLKFDAYENIVAAYVLDNENITVSSYRVPNSESSDSYSLSHLNEIFREEREIFIDEEYLYLRQIIGSNDYPLGILYLVTDANTPILNARYSLMKNAIPLGFLASLIVAAIFSWILRLQFSSVLALTRFTNKVTRLRNYEHRFRVSGNNEISVLAGSVNKMMQTIENELKVNKTKSNQLLKQKGLMEKLANFDSLTSLPNRQFIMEFLRVELARAKRDKNDLVVMFFDLDGFKGINDSLGHETGDSVLTKVARRLQSNLREGDQLARLGGDEFLLVPHGANSSKSIALIAQKIIHSMQQPFEENGLDLHIGVSIGISRASQVDFALSELISYADIAMYESKKAGKSRFTVFEDGMVTGHLRKLSIANSIPTAVTDNKFHMVYQPKMNPRGYIVGIEALLRWQNEELGVIPPDEFIPIAEKGGKIPQITRWVIDSVFKDIEALVARFGKELRVSLNLSAIDVMQMSLIDWIDEKSQQYQVNARNIEFEVTESAYMESFEETNKFFNALVKRGYFISLDDFGTGFCSLGYLTQIQVNTLKIDRQFVCDLDDRSNSVLVTQSIIDLAKRLRLSICAEGIETESQFNRMVLEGCNTLQGYWLSKPLKIEALLTINESALIEQLKLMDV